MTQTGHFHIILEKMSLTVDLYITSKKNDGFALIPRKWVMEMFQELRSLCDEENAK